MSSQAPPPSSPAGVPSNGNAKYVILALAVFGLMGAAIAFLRPKPPPPASIVFDAGPAPLAAATGRDLDEEIPLPPPIPTPSADPVEKAAVARVNNPCGAKMCAGASSPELEGALQQRVRQARRCYNQALLQNSELRGEMTVGVRVGTNGQVCSAQIVSNEMGSDEVGRCVTSAFRGVSLPPPRGGCVDINIPVNFTSR